MATTDFYPDASPETSTVDGEVGNSGSARTWATVRAGDAGDYAVDNFSPITVGVTAATSPDTNKWTILIRGALLFDTSVIGSQTIISATLNIFVEAGGGASSHNLDIVAFTPAANTSLSASDYNQFGTTILGTIARSALTNNAYNAITLNPTGLAAINGSGITKLGLRLSPDTNDVEPTWASGTTYIVRFRAAESSGTGSDPFLQVTYSNPTNLTPSGIQSQVTLVAPALSAGAAVTANSLRAQQQIASPSFVWGAGLTPAPLQVRQQPLGTAIVAGASLPVSPLQSLPSLGSSTFAGGYSRPLSPLAVSGQVYCFPSLSVNIQPPPLQVVNKFNGIPLIVYGANVQVNPLHVRTALVSEPILAGLSFATKPLSVQVSSGISTPTFGVNLGFNPLSSVLELHNASFGVDMRLQPLSGAIHLYTPRPVLTPEIRPSLIELAQVTYSPDAVYDTKIEPSTIEISTGNYQTYQQLVGVEADTKFVHVNRSASSQIIYGSTPGEPFKLNPAATVYRRQGASHVIHLGPVKPDFRTMQVLFNLVTPFTELAIGEFHYTSPGNFLEIFNDQVIQSSLIAADADTAEIPVTTASAARSSSVPVLSTFTVKRQF